MATAALGCSIASCNCITTFSQSGRSILRVARMDQHNWLDDKH